MDSCDLKVMCLAVSGKYLFSADYEGNVRSWALGTLTAVGSTVSVFVRIVKCECEYMGVYVCEDC